MLRTARALSRLALFSLTAALASLTCAGCLLDRSPLGGTEPRQDTGQPDLDAAIDPATDAAIVPADVPPSDSPLPDAFVAMGVCEGRPMGTVCRAGLGDCDLPETCDGASAECPADAVRPSGSICRGQAGVCDAAEVCDGSSPLCPADARVAAGTGCRGPAGDCDRAEACDGVSAGCPADSLAGAGEICRAGAGECDPAETCTGVSVGCPAESYAPLGTLCPGGTCDGFGGCSTCVPGALCSTGNPCEIGMRDCTLGGAGVCVGRGPAAAGTRCRPVRGGGCDQAESCDGVTTVCPADVFNVGLLCRAASGPCDAPELCDGTSANCPRDAFQPPRTVCRAAEGPCDVEELCLGIDGSCPANRRAARGTLCLPSSGGECDPADVCDGSSTNCPVADPTGEACTWPGVGTPGMCCGPGDCRRTC